MKVGKLLVFVCLSVFALPALADVNVISPGNGASVGSPVHFVATASSPGCPNGVAAMGIYTAPYQLAYVVNGSSLDTYLSLNSGTSYPVVQQWDNCGGSDTAALTLTVGSGGGGGSGTTFYNLQQSGGWTGYALLPPSFDICYGCNAAGPELKWDWWPNISSPSLSGSATQTNYGGGAVQWSDVLWNNHLIGDFSSQGLPDSGKTLVPSLSNFTYDVYFWIADARVPQALEFDINQFVGGNSFIWGHECRIAGGNEWDTWDNWAQQWVPSGIPCQPLSGQWNHLVINVQRTSDGHLLFHSINLNGNNAILDRYDTPTPSSWYGVTINYQIDGNYWGTPYSVYLDNLNFTAQ
jgi:hypothetical protein